MLKFHSPRRIFDKFEHQLDGGVWWSVERSWRPVSARFTSCQVREFCTRGVQSELTGPTWSGEWGGTSALGQSWGGVTTDTDNPSGVCVSEWGVIPRLTLWTVLLRMKPHVFTRNWTFPPTLLKAVVQLHLWVYPEVVWVHKAGPGAAWELL